MSISRWIDKQIVAHALNNYIQPFFPFYATITPFFLFIFIFVYIAFSQANLWVQY